ncbi:MAG TPA: hypothetical protein VGG92_04195 [Caulobacteraceae bacterium]|jgi:hypothetical protein
MKRPRLLQAVLAALAFAAGVLAVGWRLDHQRVACYRDQAEEQLVADTKCEHPRLW